MASMPLSNSSRRRDEPHVPAGEWERHQETIISLYRSHTLKQVVKIMTEKHEFPARRSQYPPKLRTWGVFKNSSGSKWESIARHVKRRRDDESKKSKVIIDGIEIPSKKLRKEVSRYLPSLNGSAEVDCDAALPQGVEIQTPPDSPRIRSFQERPITDTRADGVHAQPDESGQKNNSEPYSANSVRFSSSLPPTQSFPPLSVLSQDSSGSSHSLNDIVLGEHGLDTASHILPAISWDPLLWSSVSQNPPTAPPRNKSCAPSTTMAQDLSRCLWKDVLEIIDPLQWSTSPETKTRHALKELDKYLDLVSLTMSNFDRRNTTFNDECYGDFEPLFMLDINVSENIAQMCNAEFGRRFYLVTKSVSFMVYKLANGLLGEGALKPLREGLRDRIQQIRQLCEPLAKSGTTEILHQALLAIDPAEDFRNFQNLAKRAISLKEPCQDIHGQRTLLHAAAKRGASSLRSLLCAMNESTYGSIRESHYVIGVLRLATDTCDDVALAELLKICQFEDDSHDSQANWITTLLALAVHEGYTTMTTTLLRFTLDLKHFNAKQHFTRHEYCTLLCIAIETGSREQFNFLVAGTPISWTCALWTINPVQCSKELRKASDSGDWRIKSFTLPPLQRTILAGRHEMTHALVVALYNGEILYNHEQGKHSEELHAEISNEDRKLLNIYLTKHKTLPVMTGVQAAVIANDVQMIDCLLVVPAVNGRVFKNFGDTPLQTAARLGRFECAKTLLKMGADVNALPGNHLGGATALQAAAERGDHGMVDLLLEAGADINASPGTDHGKSALHAAIISGDRRTLSTLLSHRVVMGTTAYGSAKHLLAAFETPSSDLQRKALGLVLSTKFYPSAWLSPSFQHPLLLAAENRDLEFIKAYVSAGGDLDFPPPFNDPQQDLVISQRVLSFIYYVEKHVGRITYRSEQTQLRITVHPEYWDKRARTLQFFAPSSFMEAVIMETDDSCLPFAEIYPELNPTTSGVLLAAKHAAISVLKMLLGTGQKTQDETNPRWCETKHAAEILQAAADSDEEGSKVKELISWLLSKEEYKDPTVTRHVSMESAALMKHWDSVDLLLSAGADPNLYDRHSPLCLAIQDRQPHLAHKLLSVGADASSTLVRDSKGIAMGDLTDMIMMTSDLKFSDIFKRDDQFYTRLTAMEVAAESGDLGLVSRLFSPNSSGCGKALSAAARGGHLQVAQMLLRCGQTDKKDLDLSFLHAALRGRLDMVHLLLCQDPTWDLRNSSRDAAARAREAGFYNVARYISHWDPERQESVMYINGYRHVL